MSGTGIDASGGRYLLVRVGEHECALPLARVRRVVRTLAVQPLPGAAPALLGVAGLRGRLVPVWSLRILLGYPPGEAPRWLARTTGEPALAVAFDELVGHRFAHDETIAAAAGATRPHLRGSLRTETGLCAVIDLPSVLAEIRRRAASTLEPGSNEP